MTPVAVVHCRSLKPINAAETNVPYRLLITGDLSEPPVLLITVYAQQQWRTDLQSADEIMKMEPPNYDPSTGLLIRFYFSTSPQKICQAKGVHQKGDKDYSIAISAFTLGGVLIGTASCPFRRRTKQCKQEQRSEVIAPEECFTFDMVDDFHQKEESSVDAILLTPSGYVELANKVAVFLPILPTEELVAIFLAPGQNPTEVNSKIVYHFSFWCSPWSPAQVQALIQPAGYATFDSPIFCQPCKVNFCLSDRRGWYSCLLEYHVLPFSWS